MSDLGAATWSEIDASNTTTPPNGWPEGMAPSDVNNAARAGMGAEKRFWDRTNSVLTTAGTTTAYTLTYTQAATAYYDGEEFSFIVNATCGAAPTLNINALGARQIRKFVGGAFTNLAASDVVANQPLRVRYNLAATTFDVVGPFFPVGWFVYQTINPSAASTVDFTGIPAGVNHLRCVGEATVSGGAVSILLRTYGADGVLDSGGSDYGVNYARITSGALSASSLSQDSIFLIGDINSGVTGGSTEFSAANIQAATYTKFQIQGQALGSVGYSNFMIIGFRAEADRITGIRIYPSSGTFTGKFTLFASA